MINLVNYTGIGKKKTPYDSDNFTHQWMYYNYFTYRVQNIVLSDRF